MKIENKNEEKIEKIKKTIENLKLDQNININLSQLLIEYLIEDNIQNASINNKLRIKTFLLFITQLCYIEYLRHSRCEYIESIKNKYTGINIFFQKACKFLENEIEKADINFQKITKEFLTKIKFWENENRQIEFGKVILLEAEENFNVKLDSITTELKFFQYEILNINTKTTLQPVIDKMKQYIVEIKKEIKSINQKQKDKEDRNQFKSDLSEILDKFKQIWAAKNIKIKDGHDKIITDITTYINDINTTINLDQIQENDITTLNSQLEKVSKSIVEIIELWKKYIVVEPTPPPKETETFFKKYWKYILIISILVCVLISIILIIIKYKRKNNIHLSQNTSVGFEIEIQN